MFLARQPRRRNLAALCADFSRILKPEGILAATMIGPRNYYVTDFAKAQLHDGIREICIDEPGNRLYGHYKYVMVAEDEAALCGMFSGFTSDSISYVDMPLCDLKSSFHWIFIGRSAR